jgi:O-antigen/teichoic acid export membrane protein
VAFQLLVLNEFAGAFLALPLSLLRVQERARLFAGLNFLRSFGTLVLRLILVVGLRHGITGVMLADVIVTATLLVVLAKTTAGMTAWRVSTAMLRDLLRYALPHVPHGLLTQITSMADRFVLGMFMPLASVGLYQIAGTIAGVIKFYPVAFEAAWMPFAFDSLRRHDAPALFARMGTYAFGVLVLACVAVAGLAAPVMALALPADYTPVAPLVPLIVAGMAVQSLTWFLMTSINVAKQTRVYPAITAVGAVASVGGNLLLVPPFGMWGAAIALLASQALATAVAARFAQRAYRIPYEGMRLAKVLAAGAVTFVAMTSVTLASPLQTIALRVAVALLFPAGLLALRFVEPHELAELRKAIGALRRQRTADSVV